MSDNRRILISIWRTKIKGKTIYIQIIVCFNILVYPDIYQTMYHPNLGYEHKNIDKTECGTSKV